MGPHPTPSGTIRGAKFPPAAPASDVSVIIATPSNGQLESIAPDPNMCWAKMLTLGSRWSCQATIAPAPPSPVIAGWIWALAAVVIGEPHAETAAREGCGSDSKPAASMRTADMVRTAVSLLRHGDRLAVDEVVHDHEVPGGALRPATQVERVGAQRRLAGEDLDARHDRLRELHAHERESARARGREVGAEVPAGGIEQPDPGRAFVIHVREHHAEAGAGRGRGAARNEEAHRADRISHGDEGADRAEEVELLRVRRIDVAEVVVAHPESRPRGREHRAARPAYDRLVEEVGREVVPVGVQRRHGVPVDLAPPAAERPWLVPVEGAAAGAELGDRGGNVSRALEHLGLGPDGPGTIRDAGRAQRLAGITGHGVIREGRLVHPAHVAAGLDVSDGG